MDSYLTIKDILAGYKEGRFSSTELFRYYKDRIARLNPTLNAIITNVDHQHGDFLASQNPLPVIHKDVYSTEDVETTAASNILRGYIPPFDATAVTKLAEANFITLGKANCDAFAHGTTGENSDFGPTKNPYGLEYTPGGSSSGSAVAVAAGLSPLATATDTGGSIRFPASLTNTVGIKPTYGRVSRYGIIAMTSSTDSIGHITRTVWDNAYVLNKTAGYDPHDATSAKVQVDDYLEDIEQGVKGLRLGVPKEYLENIAPEIEKAYREKVDTLRNLGAEIVEDISLPHTEYGINVYYIVTPSEVSSNLARFDGIRFGQERSHFGAEAKRRIMIGTYCLSSGYYDAYYLKAQKVRTLVIQDFAKAFEKVDALIAPVSAVMQPKLGELVNDPIKNYMLDVLTIPVNLAGVPSLAVPAGFSNGLPIGLQIIGDYFDEKLLYRIGYALEQETRYFEQTPKL
ncbi:Asp-tRNA(Asn)/Glu-tRNA(Gln) amidotransferase subunit GatA [candidate division WWE3 bacterium]|uniref:Glutamyl-tRNA(Gln) amidotransferase subunit A n=1 Tax=candidate division WWE3 bacterium TaxID=2053526 RepID=A0A955LKG1_UNCKA|nr:Asp-tRNA(Asn)/Glu-tRNA(Gln) amidotransferase subunit GatA [candidate division WWE3 bacterium]